MTDDDHAVFCLCLCVMGLAGLAFLHGRMISIISERTQQVSADVEFLKDHTVARETEARPNA